MKKEYKAQHINCDKVITGTNIEQSLYPNGLPCIKINGTEIKPRTLSVDTERKDKNGKTIFSGDTLSQLVQTEAGNIQSKKRVFFSHTRNFWALSESLKKGKVAYTSLDESLARDAYQVISHAYTGDKCNCSC